MHCNCINHDHQNKTDQSDYRTQPMNSNLSCLKADFQSVLRTLESLFTTFVLFHVRRHKM